MLQGLGIRDLVLIERLDLSLRPGLSVLTGETGAGKSILLDALGLALGARAEAALVRTGAERAQVAAEFALPPDPNHPALGILAEHGLEPEDRLVLRRTLSADGRSRAFVNDQAVSAGLVRRLAATLVEIHGQFDTHGLMDPDSHRQLLDAYGGLTGPLQAVAQAHAAWRAAAEARAAAAAEAERARAEETFLRHAVQELDALDPRPGEAGALEEARRLLGGREKLLAALTTAAAELGGGAEPRLATAQRALEKVAPLAVGRLDAILAALNAAAAELAEAARALDALAAEVDLDPAALERAEERLFALRALARKHEVEADALDALRARLAGRLAALEDAGDRLAVLARAEAAARTAFAAAAAALTAARAEAAGRLDRAVMAELGPLKLERARFQTRLAPLPEEQWAAHGADRVQFMVATNPGQEPGPIARIASGGELARFMLGLKVVLAQAGSVPVLVFDEVDSGIGGATADAVGERLARLAAQVQVLVVTHSPQVAARGDHHWQVAKRVAEGRALTEVRPLDLHARREEIARMLSGAEITAEARAAAQRLLAPSGRAADAADLFSAGAAGRRAGPG